MLHPQARAALAGEEGASPYDDATDIVAERAAARLEALTGPREEVGQVRDLDAGGVRVRVYWPKGAVTAGADDLVPTIVHLHGGGFVFNDIDVHDGMARRLTNRSGLAVVSVDYRRPPEHRFPAAPDDVDTVLGWLGREGVGLGLDADRLFSHGDSAGANLALVAALRHPGTFSALVLIYPFIDASMRCASYDEALGLFNRDESGWYWRQYASRSEDYTDPDFSPFESDRLDTLPPTLVVTGEHDPLRDEGEQLAARIAESGVSCVGTRYLGMLHGFWRHPDDFDASETLTRQVAAFLQQHRERRA